MNLLLERKQKMHEDFIYKCPMCNLGLMAKSEKIIATSNYFMICDNPSCYINNKSEGMWIHASSLLLAEPWESA
jgi:hypothetical protein